MEIHVGSVAFWARAAQDLAAARRRVLIQAMTFEGDDAGRVVAEAVGASGAGDRRVLVDDYTRHVINDTFVNISRDPETRAEAEATRAMFERLALSGAGIRVTNPIGRNWLRYPLRNHKKLILADDVAWIGGINFSDHNFAWHDAMLRIDDLAVAEWLAEGFDADWDGVPQARIGQPSADLELIDLPGEGNAALFAPLLRRFHEARRSIEVISAYPTFPFVDAFVDAARRGIAATIYTPRPNNKPIVREYLLALAGRCPIAVRLLPEMTHVKAALIDREVLIVGSSNFDFVSYRANADYVAIIQNSTLVAQAEALLFAPAREKAAAPAPGETGRWRGRAAGLALHIADGVIARLRHGQRITDWPAPSDRTSLAEPARRG